MKQAGVRTYSYYLPLAFKEHTPYPFKLNTQCGNFMTIQKYKNICETIINNLSTIKLQFPLTPIFKNYLKGWLSYCLCFSESHRQHFSKSLKTLPPGGVPAGSTWEVMSWKPSLSGWTSGHFPLWSHYGTPIHTSFLCMTLARILLLLAPPWLS